MAFRPRLTLVIGSIALAAVLAGCGSQSPIKGALSQSANSSISGELSAVSDAVNSSSCKGATTSLTKLDATLSGLPSTTNSKLVANLKQGSATLRGLALKECHGTTTKTSTSSSTTSSTTSSTPTTTTTTTTTTPTTTSTTTTETQTQTQTNTLPGTGTVTTLQNQSGTNTNGGAGLGSGGG